MIASIAAPIRLRLSALPASHRRFGLVAYGVGISALAVTILVHQAPAVTLLGARQSQVHDALNSLNHGGPLLAGLVNGQYYPFQIVDEGIDVYLPLLGQLFGQSDPNILMKWFFLGAFAIPLAIYPLVFAEVFDSLIIGLIAPLLFLWRLGFTHFADIYWAYVWAPVLALPLLMLIYRRYGRGLAVSGLIGVMFVASFSNTIREGSGLPILVAVVLLLLLVNDTRRRKLLIGAGCVLAYLAITPGLFGVITSAATAELNTPAHRSHVIYPPIGQGSGFWHSLYIGLSFQPNRHGIPEENDSVAIDYVQRIDPNAKYLSARYEKILRQRFVYLLTHDPGFVVSAEVKKALVALDDGITSGIPLLLLLPPLLLVGARRRFIRASFLFTLPAGIVGAAVAIVSVPAGLDRLTGYELGLYGAVAFAWILAVLFVIRYLLDVLPDLRGHLRAARDHLSGDFNWPTRYRASLVLVLASIAGAVGLHALSAPARQLRRFVAGSSKTLLKPTGPLQEIASWSFARNSALIDWTSEPSTHTLPTQYGLAVQTNTTLGYQLLSPPVSLARGLYRLTVTGVIASGAISIDILDQATNRFLAGGRFWYGQTYGGPRPLPLDLQLTSAAPVRIVFSNWLPSSSRWLVQSVTLQKVLPRHRQTRQRLPAHLGSSAVYCELVGHASAERQCPQRSTR